LTQISTVAVDDEKRIWVGGGEGVFVSADNGLTWTKPQELVVSGVNGLYFDTSGQRMLVTSFQSNFVYAVHVPDGKVTYWDSGWKLRFARPVGDHLIGATLYDGVVVQPVMVAEK
jgi:sugar lactone lactonase YvrE